MIALLPVLAEVADKLPATGQMWTQVFAAGLVVAAAIGGLTLVRPSWGLFGVAIMTLGAAILASDHSLDAEIRGELGGNYVIQRRCAPLVPAAFAALGWLCVRGRWRCSGLPKPDADSTVA